jgi:nicotinate-nucleotide adenylyltransferase
MKIGLFFGSFNPIHIGHLVIATHVLNYTDLQKIWFVVSPQNPLKPTKSLLGERNRLHLARLAVEDDTCFRVSDIEFSLPRPSYTIDTLLSLKEKFPHDEFSIVMGSDSFKNLSQWKNHSILVRENRIIVYERPDFEVEDVEGNYTIVKNAPMLHISATFIRQLVKEKKSIKYLVPDKVLEEIEKGGYYKSS